MVDKLDCNYVYYAWIYIDGKKTHLILRSR